MLTELERELMEALKALSQSFDDYSYSHNFALPDSFDSAKAVIARAEAKAKEPQCKCNLCHEGAKAPICAEGFSQSFEVDGEYCGNIVLVDGEWVDCGHPRACHIGGEG